MTSELICLDILVLILTRRWWQGDGLPVTRADRTDLPIPALTDNYATTIVYDIYIYRHICIYVYIYIYSIHAYLYNIKHHTWNTTLIEMLFMQSGQPNGILCLAKDEDWFLFREAHTESMANVGGTFVGAGMCNSPSACYPPVNKHRPWKSPIFNGN